jgi:inorganic triphosphatase YgiF
VAETELKLAIAPEDHERFAALAALAAATPSRKRLTSLYFDTPAHDLRRREMALRLRRSGRRWAQALKAGRSGNAGLHSRDEFEYGRGDASIDLSLFVDTPLAKMPRARKLHRSLGEIFRVDVVRTAWNLELAPGTRVEVALDRGTVTRGNAHEEVSEVEIEIVEGPAIALYDLAERLAGAVALRVSAVTKAERGYRLARGETLEPVKAVPAELEAAMPAHEAARLAIAAAIAHLQANEAGVLSSDDPEFVHQMRVALRRLRSALRAFRKATGPELEARVRDDLHWITQATGKARDLDVLAIETLPAILAAGGAQGAALERRLAARRGEALGAVRADIRSPRYAKLMLTLSRWLAQSAAEPPRSDHAARALAAKVLGKRHARVVRDAAALETMAPRQRHRLRIQVKRLRYAAEGFAPLFRRKAMDAYIDRLGRLQDGLGRANDAAVARRLLDELSAPARLAAFARGWLARESAEHVAEMRREARALRHARLPWERS